MLLAFVDESDRGDFRCFAAVVGDEHATKALTDRLNAIVRQASVDFGVPRTSEIHGHPLFHGKDDWKDVGARARAGIHEKVIDAILVMQRHNPVALCKRGATSQSPGPQELPCAVSRRAGVLPAHPSAG